MTNRLNLENHPCFNADVRHLYGRIHLPVAPRCNIQCNFCNRKYDCVSESRPGVTQAVLSPQQAVHYLERALAKNPGISVVGIAGPGDPFANPDETLNTLRLAHERFPHLLSCVASNGLNIVPYIADLARFRISHATLTINAVEPEIGRHIYAWVRDQKVIYRERDAAEILLERQLQAIKELKAHGITVKINSIIIPGVNEHHLGEIARQTAELGADIMNCIPIYPIADTPFESIEPPNTVMVSLIRNEAGCYLPQMEHCARCRADAAGIIGKDDSEIGKALLETAQGPLNPAETRSNVAIATREGILINQHLGEATFLKVYQKTNEGFVYLEDRQTPAPGSGAQRWMELAVILNDCGTILINGVGESPKTVLNRQGLKVIETQGLINEALNDLASGRELPKARPFSCGSSCKGSGLGCG